MDEDGGVNEERRYARRMLADAVAWPTDRKVLLAPMEDGNARVVVDATTILADPSTGLCVVQLTDRAAEAQWFDDSGPNRTIPDCVGCCQGCCQHPA